MSTNGFCQTIMIKMVLFLVLGVPTFTSARIGETKLSSLSRRDLSKFEDNSFSVDLMHVYLADSQHVLPNPTFSKRLALSLESDKERRKHLLQMIKAHGKNDTFGMEHPKAKPSTEMKITRLRRVYLMHIGVGEHAAPLDFVMDTASQATWAMCLPCDPCPQEGPRHHNHFDPATSSSYVNVLPDSNECRGFQLEGSTKSSSDGRTCEYSLRYGTTLDPTTAEGVLAHETFTFKFGPTGKQVKPYEEVVFGCTTKGTSQMLSDVDGIVGLSRGPLSIVAQMGLSAFSYCMVDFRLHKTRKGKFNFGRKDLHYQIAKLIPPDLAVSTGYYLDLKGILVAGEQVSFPRGFLHVDPQYDDRRIDLLIDSGSEFSVLNRRIYDPLKAAITSKVTYPVLTEPTRGDGDLDLCYNIIGQNKPYDGFPQITLQFQNMNLVLPQNNVFMQTVQDRMICLVISPDPNWVNILGAVQQQNFDVLYDIGENEIGFSPQDCK